jgi:HEAT repeat protein
MSSRPIDYLQFLCQRPQPERQFYIETLVTLATPKVDRQAPREETSASCQAVERLPPVPVLTGLRQYALGEQQEHVLLAGRPGLGKSTTLKQLLLELAEVALTDETQPIPVLVELKGDRSIPDLIIAEFRRARLRVTAEQIDDWLLTDKLVLLLDGINETPDKWRGKLQEFCDDNRTTPMIFTTRDLAIGGDLGITKRLEMRPLTKPQMREFVQSYLDHRGLPEHVDRLLGQLKDDLREVAETPLLLEMLCDVYSDSRLLQKGVDLKSKGELFRLFDREYQHIKQNIQAVPVSEHFWEFKSEVLQQLAFIMMQANAQKSTEAWFTLPKDQAERFLEQWLTGRGLADAPTKAKLWLKDLLSYHLLQVAADPEKIEFHHQLFQEYYAAKALLVMLEDKHPDVMDNQRLQHFYLNYLKWTEPFSIMLALLEDETQALQVVRLALDVDLMLGARLAGEVKRELQQQTVGMVSALDIPEWLKIELWGETRSEVIVPGLFEALKNGNCNVIQRAASAFKKHDYVKAIPALLNAIDHPSLDFYASYSIATITGELSAGNAIPILLKALEELDSPARLSAVSSLGENRCDLLLELLPVFLKLLQDTNLDMRRIAAEALENVTEMSHDIRLTTTIPRLLQAVKDPDLDVYLSVTKALGNLGSTDAIPDLLQALKDSDECVRVRAAMGLGNLGSADAIPDLLQALKDQDSLVRDAAAYALDDINRRVIVNPLITDPCSSVRGKMVEAPGEIRSTKAIPALGHIGSAERIPSLFKIIEECSEDEEEWSHLRSNAARELGNFKGDHAAHILPNLLTLIPTASGEAAFRALTAIQANCQFYNYEVARWELAPPSLQPMTPVPAITYTIDKVGILNTGPVSIQGNQMGSLDHDSKT